jgi:hypothetical protein
MGRIERRQRLALDESYRYFRGLEAGEKPDLFKLSRSLSNLSAALFQIEGSEFKLTRQLWTRLHEGLFEYYITCFAGTFVVRDASGTALEHGRSWPEQGFISFRPHGCRRLEDTASISMSRLYPGTLAALQQRWKQGVTHIEPSGIEKKSACNDGVCFVRPMLLGEEVLKTESQNGKEKAYQHFWELYLQAYCTPKKHERAVLVRSMLALEAVWGNLYY